MRPELENVIREVEKAIAGKRGSVEKILMALLADGHVLLDDVPGVGKTTLAVALSRAVGLKFQRIQCTPDVLPSDIVGFSMPDKNSGEFIYRPGAISQANLVLVDEINREGTLALEEEFCRDVVKAAPMHDLGKIAVDDAVLRKPGKFTDEEYAKMKQHAAECARVIHEILRHTDDESFKQVAENVAHYHHERWDGSGYPERLQGEQIPVEARIMAVADVYDALVSRRVYKEAFDFERA